LLQAAEECLCTRSKIKAADELIRYTQFPALRVEVSGFSQMKLQAFAAHTVQQTSYNWRSKKIKPVEHMHTISYIHVTLDS
jgi:hypothetical protein